MKLLSFVAEGKKEGVAVANFNWKEAIADSAIVGGMSGFASITTQLIMGDPLRAISSFFIAFGIGFFTTLGAKRGLTKRIEYGLQEEEKEEVKS